MMVLPARRAVQLLIFVGMGNACGRTELGTSPRADDLAVASTSDASATWQAPSDGACPDGFTSCGHGEGAQCYDVNRSASHCGACGHACPLGIACQSGSCQQYRCKGALSFEGLPAAATLDADYSPALGDFDQDGTLDLAGMPDAKGAMTLLYGASDGTFPTRRVIDPASVGHWVVLAADVDGDGRLDLASIGGGQTAVTVRPGSGHRDDPFGAAIRYPTSNSPAGLLLADLDADGRPDLVSAERGLLEQWQGCSDGHFRHFATLVSPDTDVPGASYTPLAVDWNRDGILDLVYGPANLHVRPGRADGSFGAELTCPLQFGCIGDVDGDNRLDLLNQAGLLLGLDSCHASKIVPLKLRRDAALADFDGDANLDVVSDAGAGVAIRVGDGKGGFGQLVSLPGIDTGGLSGSVFLVGDLNRDGKLDLVLVRSIEWRVFLNSCS